MCYCWTEEVCFQKAAPASLRMNVTVFREWERGLLFLAIADCHLCMGKEMWLLVVSGKPYHHHCTVLHYGFPGPYFCKSTSIREFTHFAEFTSSLYKYCFHFIKIKWSRIRADEHIWALDFTYESVKNNTLIILAWKFAEEISICLVNKQHIR